MKIIWIDNFNRESVSDRLVAENIQDQDEARTMVAALNKSYSDYGPDYFRLVADDHKLHVYDPT